ncbi:MAG: hypothetical protein LCI03_16410 [Actinobacteria bacterium]|jgi:hypothetical protein|nr:hypothetical protein [Actinomycetota bacterium]
MSEHSSVDVDHAGARVEDAVREGSDERVREAREEAVERAAESGLPDAMRAPQDEGSSIATPAASAAAARDAGASGDGVGEAASGAWQAPGDRGAPAVAQDEPVPASGRMGDATYGSGLAGEPARDEAPATQRGDGPQPGAEHLKSSPEARNPANESPATLGIDDTDTALADEDAT